MPIEIWACEAGKGASPIAKQLANLMKGDVPYIKAPNAYAIWEILGVFFIDDSLLPFIYVPSPFSDGKFVIFNGE